MFSFVSFVIFSSHVSFILCDGNITSPGILKELVDDHQIGLVEVTPGTEFQCGEGYCECDMTISVARCVPSVIPGSGIGYIPKFPVGIKTLYFREQDVTSFKLTLEFFANATGVIKLLMDDNNLVDLEPGCLDGMKRLRQLYLRGNKFTPATVQYLIHSKRLLKLVLDDNNIGNLPRDIFKGLTILESYLRVLSLNGNKMTLVNLDDVGLLASLKELFLTNNELRDIQMTQPFYFLSKLNLASNSFVQFPSTCCGSKRESLFPQLSWLDISENRINSIRPDICLPNLKQLHLNNNRFKEFVPWTFSSEKFPNLQTLQLIKSTGATPSVAGDYAIPPDMKNYFINNPALEYLDLTNCGLDFWRSVRNHDMKPFENCRSLHFLYLDGNTFRYVDKTQFRELFGNLPLLDLSMRNCQLDKVSTVTSAGLKYLMKLNLRDNMISSIPDGAFDSMPDLKELDLAGNAISVVKEWTFNAQMRNNFNELIIGNNPFSCTCDLLWFRNWLRANSNLFDDKPFSGSPVYVCNNLPNTKVRDFILHPQACLLSPETCKMITGVLSLIVLTMTGFLLLFSYRWHLRLLLYEAFRGRDDGVRQRRLQQNNFDYDVFVSYDSDDSLWVRRRLMPELEDRLGFKLCIHERNFIPGHNIVDNIAECVERSKKILMVFSTSFVKSQWCQFELAYCLRHVMDYDDNLIIVCVDDVVSREMTTTTMAVLKTTTYIQWAEFGEAVQSFWGRLKIALNEIVAQV